MLFRSDAINKGMKACDAAADGVWAVPYLPIDPRDVGRSYESIIRINSQSGKGGVAWIMDREFGFQMPKEMHPEFGAVIQKLTDREGRELQMAEIWVAFKGEYLSLVRPYGLISFNVVKRHVDTEKEHSSADVEAVISVNGEARTFTAAGNGPLDAFCTALKNGLDCEFTLCGYHEHALTKGSSSKAVAYIETEYPDGRKFWGAGVDTDIIIASIKAMLSSLNRAARL